MINILHITPHFNYSCGRSRLAFLYLKYFGNNKNYETHFITNGGDSLDRLQEIPDLHYDKFNFSTGYKNIFYKRSFYRKLKDYVLKNKINLIHTHHRFPEIVSVRVGKELNVKTVASAHSFVKGLKRISFKSDKVISVSNSISDYLYKNYDIERKRIITLYNPVDQFPQIDFKMNNRIKKEHNLSSDKKVLLFIGRISKVKGFDSLLKSFTVVKGKNKNVILIINGQIESKNFNLKSISNNDSIIYVPPRKDSYYLYSIADIIILPSRIDPFPFVMIEAGAFKKPFTGGNTGGIAEFIEDGKNGLLIDPENPEQLAEKIIYLLNNPDMGKVLGENLYEKVNHLCEYNNYFNEVEKIYNSLLKPV
jgi:glycosyltransferase involved in cell wall biosynthesis